MNAEHISRKLRDALADTPYVCGELPGIGGEIKALPEHFQVEEVLPYEPCGQGDHLYLTLRRRGWNTADVARALAEAFGCRPGDVGFGGRKDRRAVATQTFSLPMPANPDRAAVMETLGGLPFEIVSVHRHRNKIKIGHVAANRFTILVTGVNADDLPAASAIGEALRRRGIANYFGPQRFGTDMRNLDRAAALVARGRRVRSRKETFLVSALQAGLFNVWLKTRIQEHGLDTILDGDVAQKTDTGGMFLVEDPREAGERLAARGIVYTGPIFGHKMRAAQGPAGDVERRILERFDLTREQFKPLRAGGSRRPALLFPDALEILPRTGGLEFSFQLPSGAYATTVLREFLRPPTAGGDAVVDSTKAAAP